MIPNSYDIKTEGTPDENKVRMSFDEDAMGHLMAKLTDMYSDRVAAVVREPATNAWDSHQRAGNPDPIEVTLPTTLDPVYIVRDRGTGMTVDTVYSVFGKYGGSTKREDNVESGYMGLGCKAPLTYTSQYVLITRKNGIESTWEVTRDADGGGAIEVMDTCATEEPDGTEVLIPVSNVWEFNDKANRIFRFWEPGSVLVNGEEPSHEWSSDTHGVHVDPDIKIATSYSLSSDYVVQGNIAYPVDHDHRLIPDDNSMKAVVRVPMGTVAFTPNREALDYTRPTVELLDVIRSLIPERMARAAEELVASAESASQAFDWAQRWRSSLDDEKYPFIWNGKIVPGYQGIRARGHMWWGGLYPENPGQRFAKFPVESFSEKFVHVLGYGSNSLRRDVKLKVAKWIEDNLDDPNDVAGVVFYTDSSLIARWRSADVVTLDYETDVKPIQVRPPKPAKNRVLTHRYLKDNSYVSTITEDDLAPYKKILFFSPTQKDRGYIDFAHAFPKDDTIVCIVNKNQWAKFKRTFPQADHVADVIAKEMAAFLRRLSKNEKAAIRYAQKLQTMRMAQLPHDKIEDPELAELLKAIHSVKQWKAKKYDGLVMLSRTFRVKLPELDDDAKEMWDAMLSKQDEYTVVHTYLEAHRYYSKISKNDEEVCVETINSLYRTRQEKP